jgi:hypothetical protein
MEDPPVSAVDLGGGVTLRSMGARLFVAYFLLASLK